MTRINCAIAPAELSDPHLIAEHREIIRIPNQIKKGKYLLNGIPTKFKLGTGHVKFFYNKLLYLHNRYTAIFEECVHRGFNINCYDECFHNVPPELYNNYSPTTADRLLLIERLQQRDKNYYNELSHLVLPKPY